MKTLAKLMIVATLVLVPAAAHAEEGPPIDMAKMEIQILDQEATDLKFEAESMLLANRRAEAAKLYTEQVKKLEKRAELLAHVVWNAPSKRVSQAAHDDFDHNTARLKAARSALRTVQIPIASND